MWGSGNTPPHPIFWSQLHLKQLYDLHNDELSGTACGHPELQLQPGPSGVPIFLRVSGASQFFGLKSLQGLSSEEKLLRAKLCRSNWLIVMMIWLVMIWLMMIWLILQRAGRHARFTAARRKKLPPAYFFLPFSIRPGRVLRFAFD